MRNVHLKNLAFTSALLWAGTAGLHAQGLTSSGITGTLLNKDGQPLIGVTVDIVHEPSGARASTVTRVGGQFNVSGLRVGGPYTVSASPEGLASTSQKGIFLELDHPTAVSLVAGSDVVVMDAFVVEVDGDADFGAGKMGTATNFRAQDVLNTPSVRRNIQDVATLDTRLTVMSLDQGGQMSASGQNFRYNSFLIDGVQANDPFGLNSNGFSSLRSPIPMEAIEAFSVELNPYSVRRSGFTGALLNAVIKSGTNEFHGSVYGEKGDKKWRAKNPVSGVREGFKERSFGFTLGGPLIKNKLFFFLNYDDFLREAAPPTNNFVPNSDSLNAIIARADALGYDAGSLAKVDTNKSFQKTLLGKLDWNINNNHRASFTYRKNEGEEASYPDYSGTTTVSLSNYWFQQPRDTESYTGQVFSSWTPDFRTEVTYSSTKYDGSPVNNGSPFPRVAVNGVTGTRLDTGATATGTVVLGTENSRQFNGIESIEDLGRVTGEYSLGAHTLVFGLENSSTEYENKFVQNVFGNYTFLNVASWEAGTGVSNFQLAKLNPGYTMDDSFAAWKYDARAVFIEDTWKVTPRLSLLAGLRYDYPYINQGPAEATGFETAFGFKNNTTNSGNATLAPRVGFNYTLPTQSKTEIRGGVGLFQGRNPAVWISNAYSNSGAIGNVSVNNPAGFTFSSDVDNQPIPAGNPPAPSINVTDPDFVQPASWKGNLAVDHTLPWGGLTVTVEVNHLRVEQALFTEYMNYNVSPYGTTPDGRILYGANADVASTANFDERAPLTPTGTFAVGNLGATAFTGAGTRNDGSRIAFNSASVLGRRRVSTGGPTGGGFADVFRLSNTNKGESTDYSVSIRRRMKDNWGWSLSYTHNNSTEVSPMTSSTASSNYGNRAVFNPNEDVASTSNYEVKHRIVATATRKFNFIKKAPTTISAIYQGRTGRPYSWVFRGDANGDGFTFNDLLYVPTGADDAKVRFASDSERDAFFAFVNSSPLAQYKGTNPGRNSEVSPWVQTIDLRIVQEIPIYRNVKTEIYANLINLANLIDKDWGIQEEVPFSYKRAVAGATYDRAGNNGAGQWVYTYNSTTLDTVPVTANDSAVSRWQVVVGARVSF